MPSSNNMRLVELPSKVRKPAYNVIILPDKLNGFDSDFYFLFAVFFLRLNPVTTGVLRINHLQKYGESSGGSTS